MMQRHRIVSQYNIITLQHCTKYLQLVDTKEFNVLCSHTSSKILSSANMLYALCTSWWFGGLRRPILMHESAV